MIFISFAGENAELARALGLRMRAAGAEVWCSVFKDDLDDGRPWRDQVYAALDKCDTFVVLASGAPPDATTDDERARAIDRHNKEQRPTVIPVRPDSRIALAAPLLRFDAVTLPVDWDSDASDFVPKKLRQWGEFVARAPATVPTPPPPASALWTPRTWPATPAPKSLDTLDPLRPPRARLLLPWLVAAIAAASLVWVVWVSIGPKIPVAVDPRTSAPGVANPVESPASAVASRAPLDAAQVLDMARIPSGKFLMGDSDSAFDNERPQHEVTVAAFDLAKTEVTRGQWREVMRIDPRECGWSTGRSDDWLPANNLTWEEAQAFCVALSKRDGSETAPRYRLPSEAEWEYACRAGTTTEYSSGDNESDLARVGWYGRNSDDRLRAVGEKNASPWGLFDMHGSVWEWCEDSHHRNYVGAPNDGSAWGGGSSSYHMLRGGSFDYPPELARSAYRLYNLRSIRWDNTGFRPARSVTTD